MIALALAGCGTTASSKRNAGDRPAAAADTDLPLYSGADGPPAQPPSGLEATPDAEPRDEAIVAGGANRPYEVFGASYVPIVDDRRHQERGLASWYGRRFHGRRTASGERYDMYAMTAAHRTLPIPSYVRVRNPANGRSAILRVNDRGPFHSKHVIDVSYAAAAKLGILRGAMPVEISRLTRDDIRSGQWREEPAPNGSALPATTADTGAEPLPAGRQSVATTAAVSAPPTLFVTDLVSVALVPAPVVPPADPPPAAATAGWWVQLGAFRDPAGAEELQRRIAAGLDWLAPLLAVFHESSVHRLQAGPYVSRVEAADVQRRIDDALGLSALVVERR